MRGTAEERPGIQLNVLDITDPLVQTKLGTTLTELTGSWALDQSQGMEPPTQLLGQVAYESKRIVGIHYTSSKNAPAGRCLAVFPDRLVPDEPSYVATIDPTGAFFQRLP